MAFSVFPGDWPKTMNVSIAKSTWARRIGIGSNTTYGMAMPLISRSAALRLTDADKRVGRPLLGNSRATPNKYDDANPLVASRHGGFDSGVPDRERLLLAHSSLSDEIQVTEFVRQRTAPSEPIFVGVRNHCISFVDNVRAYWLAERLPAAEQAYLDAAVGIDETVQRDTIAALRPNPVNYASLYDAS